MKTICEICFSNSFRLSDSLLGNDKLFWVGYLLCDPKIFSFRQNEYDLHINEVKEMNFDNLPVVFNHNKVRNPLGHVILTWHDHYDCDRNVFSVGFLAVINNKAFLSSPASVIIMSENSVSLSTLKSDRTKPVELSITYCGARKGCLGVFIPRKKVWGWCGKFGLYRNSSLYKCKKQNQNIDATFNNMSEDNGTSVEGITDEKSDNLLSSLMQLPKEQYQQISESMKKNQTTIENLIQEVEEYRNTLQDSKQENTNYCETINLLSDFLTSMIKTRLELERHSDNEMAVKKRSDFEELRKRNIFDKDGVPDLKHIKDLLLYCKECLCTDLHNESEIVNKVIESFKSYFPELQIPTRGRTTKDTIDAAFEILNENVSKLKRTKDLIDRSKINQEKASMEIARKNYDSLQKFSSSHNDQDINGHSDSNKKTMDFEEFVKDTVYRERELASPSPKRRKLNQPTKESMKYNDDFYNYVKKKEEMKRRLDEYHDEYTKHVEKKNEERKKQLDELFNLMPKLKEVVQNIQTQPPLPGNNMEQKLESGTEGMKSKEIPQPQPSGQRNGQPSLLKQFNTPHPLQKTIDASSNSKNGNELLYDL